MAVNMSGKRSRRRSPKSRSETALVCLPGLVRRNRDASEGVARTTCSFDHTIILCYAGSKIVRQSCDTFEGGCYRSESYNIPDWGKTELTGKSDTTGKSRRELGAQDR